MDTSQTNLIRLFLGGDVMTGRGIDQVLPHPGSPALYEPHLRDARQYVRLAEQAHGTIEEPVAFKYIWGDVLEELERSGTDVRIVNLETSITACEDYWPDKMVLYRMNPRNIGCLTAARIDCCSLANNHVLDWGYDGLEETLGSLESAGISYAGAGRDAETAKRPAVLDVGDQGRVIVFALGSPTSGIPAEWIATADRPGVNLLADLSGAAAEQVGEQLREIKKPGDAAVASIHWGPNWGYGIPPEQTDFAHRLVEQGFDIVFGHSSHHVKSIELFRDRLILYGCGDFLTDYEGIGGREQYRGDLALMYLVAVDPEQGQVVETRMVPMRSRRFRLTHASRADAEWLCNLLNCLGKSTATQVQIEDDNSLRVQ